MRAHVASTGLLLVAVLAASACRTRLPVEPAASAVAQETAPRAAEHEASGLAAFLHAGRSAEQVSTDPLRPFLAEVKTDRLQDMVRMELLTDHRRGPLSFLTDCAYVCVPGQDH